MPARARVCVFVSLCVHVCVCVLFSLPFYETETAAGLIFNASEWLTSGFAVKGLAVGGWGVVYGLWGVREGSGVVFVWHTLSVINPPPTPSPDHTKPGANVAPVKIHTMKTNSSIFGHIKALVWDVERCRTSLPSCSLSALRQWTRN